LEVHAGVEHLGQQAHIALLDMPAVLAQVDGDAIGAGLLREQRRLDRVRVAGTASLTQGGDVVDIDAEKNTGGMHEWLQECQIVSRKSHLIAVCTGLIRRQTCEEAL
ncbi:hypothetical protein AOR10_24590, partial [Vibrio alginolyticus]